MRVRKRGKKKKKDLDNFVWFFYLKSCFAMEVNLYCNLSFGNLGEREIGKERSWIILSIVSIW